MLTKCSEDMTTFCRHPLYVFFLASLWAIPPQWNKHKNNLMTESYFFMFRRLQNNITCFFWKKHFYKQQQAEIRHEIITASNIKRRQKKLTFSMKDLLSKGHYCYKIHTLLMKSSAYLFSSDNPLPLPCMDYPYLPQLHFYEKTLKPLSMIFQKPQTS